MKYPTIRKLGLLREGVIIPDPARVETLLTQMFAAGDRQVQVLTDFDHTVTHWESTASFGHTLCDSPLNPPGYRKRVVDLDNEFIKYVRSSTLSEEEKASALQNICNECSNSLTLYPMPRKTMHGLIESASFRLRDNAKDFIELLQSRGVPLVLISAGCADVIDKVLTTNLDIEMDGIKVISNRLKWNEDDKAVGYLSDRVHPYNKGVRNSILHDYFATTGDSRKFSIVMGDVPGDSTLARLVTNKETCLKIAYVNPKEEKILNQYESLFDIILVKDPSMQVPMSVIMHIRDSPKPAVVDTDGIAMTKKSLIAQIKRKDFTSTAPGKAPRSALSK